MNEEAAVIHQRPQSRSPAAYPIGKSVLLTASWLTMYVTASLSLLVSIPRFVVSGDGAGRGRARWLAARRVESFNHIQRLGELNFAAASCFAMQVTAPISLPVLNSYSVVGL